MVAIATESSGKREQQFGMPEASPDRIRAPDTVEGLQQIEPVAPFHLAGSALARRAGLGPDGSGNENVQFGQIEWLV
jgi:hypothetical protein